MRCLVSSLVLLASLAPSLPAVSAEVLIAVDKTTQRMSVSVDGERRHAWPVSTDMAG